MYRQLAREARLALLLTCLYILGWVGFAYFSPTGKGITGFPLWFELSCIFFPIIFILIAIIAIKKIYKEVNLEGENSNEQ